jgi:SMODS domain-containing protein
VTIGYFNGARTADAISRRFSTLLDRIAPSSKTSETARRRVSDIADCIGGSFDIARPLAVGSFNKDTAIKWYSDVDFFVALTRDAVRWGPDRYKSSSTVLKNIGSVLRTRYRNTDVSRDGVAITIRFERGDAPIDVVPAVYMRHDAALKSPIYLMPDGRDGWMATAPDGQRAALVQANRASTGKLLRVIRLLKWWARCRDVPVPIISYHLEAVLISETLVAGVGRYSQLLSDVLARLVRRNGAAIRDPLGVSGNIAFANTDAKVASAIRSLRVAADRASAAVCAEEDGDLAGAIKYWQMILPEFPV